MSFERPSSIAGQPGRCGLCDGEINEGDEIVLIDGEWCHADCAYGEDEDRRLQGDLPL